MRHTLARLGIAGLCLSIPCLAPAGQDAHARAAAGSVPPAGETETPNGPLPLPLPLLPPDNWWNLDISGWPVDPNSGTYINFINNGGPCRQLHPDFGGDSDDFPEIFGFPFIVVDEVPLKAVEFDFADESDGVDHGNGDTPFPFYPIPDQAITQPKWIEGGYPGNQCVGGDRHILIVDRNNRNLYELYAMCWDGVRWTGGSGAFFDLETNARRPEGWTSADAAGLAILPGLVRHDEAFGPEEIDHAFRFTVRATNGHVYPASHTACTACPANALPMGARLRLKANVDISAHPPYIQKIFRAMKRYGLIVADNGSDMFISGAYDTRWDNDELNPAFHGLTACDFDVITLGHNPPPPAPVAQGVTPATGTTAGGTVVLIDGVGFRTGATVSIGGAAATGVSVQRSTQVLATTPAHAAGPVSVVVTNPGGLAGTLASGFTFCAGAPAAPALTAPLSVPVDSVNGTASVPAAGGTTFRWSLRGGLITAGQDTNAVTFSAGTPGTFMTIGVTATSAGCASAAAAATVMVDFLDVPASHIFHDFVRTLARTGITGGCGNGRFCESSSVTRAQMAVFLLTAAHGPAFVPPPATGTMFADVPANAFAAAWIEQLAREGITGGCATAPLRYCPTAPVSRGEMAVFLVRARYGGAFVPPPATGVFADVPASNPFAAWIEKVFADGVTGGCASNPLRYCPTTLVSRGQMSVFLVANFGL
jgi:hypothetical protein